jgi:hypothetical protein
MDIVAAHKEDNPYWKKLTENLGAFNEIGRASCRERVS